MWLIKQFIKKVWLVIEPPQSALFSTEHAHEELGGLDYCACSKFALS